MKSRFQLRIDPKLLADAKKLAKKKRITMAMMIEQLLIKAVEFDKAQQQIDAEQI